MLLKWALLLKLLAIKTCLLPQWDDGGLGSEPNSWREPRALESQLWPAVMGSVSPADPFLKGLDSVWRGQKVLSFA